MKTYADVLKNARECIGPYCKACPECNGKACRHCIPGPGAKGVGDVAIRNYDQWKKIRVQMDTIVENKEPDLTLHIFDQTFRYPIFVGPVGAVQTHYGKQYDDITYNEIMVSACAQLGIAAFTPEKRIWRILSKIFTPSIFNRFSSIARISSAILP